MQYRNCKVKTWHIGKQNSHCDSRVRKNRWRIRCKTIRNHLVSSATIFQNCNLPGVSRITRCQVLRDFAWVKNPKKWPSLNRNNMLKYYLLKLTARFWKINSSNSGTRGCGAGPSRVTLNLSVHKAYKKKS